MAAQPMVVEGRASVTAKAATVRIVGTANRA
jgi:hypothetical protein